MEEILKYISFISMSGAGVSFIIGLLKWIDSRNRDIKQKEYESFHQMIKYASGVNDSENTIQRAQQLAAIYQLQMYKEYSFATIPILEDLKESLTHDTLLKAINITIESLRN